MIVTPFDPYFPLATQDSGITTVQQPLVTQEPGAETVALRRPSSLPPIPLPISRPVTPVPVGLTGKELARWRAEALTSQQPDNPRLGGSTSNVPRLTVTSSQTAIADNAETGGAASPYDTRRLHSEFESLRREVDRLRAEGVVITAPPSYTGGNGP